MMSVDIFSALVLVLAVGVAVCAMLLGAYLVYEGVRE